MKSKIEKVFENFQFIVLGLLILGQCTVGSNFFVGQFVYLCANAISLTRCFALRRPVADKVKDACCLGITAGLIIIKTIGIRS